MRSPEEIVQTLIESREITSVDFQGMVSNEIYDTVQSFINAMSTEEMLSVVECITLRDFYRMKMRAGRTSTVAVAKITVARMALFEATTYALLYMIERHFQS